MGDSHLGEAIIIITGAFFARATPFSSAQIALDSREECAAALIRATIPIALGQVRGIYIANELGFQTELLEKMLFLWRLGLR